MPSLDEIAFVKEIWKKNFKAIKKRILQLKDEPIKLNAFAEVFAKHAMLMYQNEDYIGAKNMYFICLLSVEYGSALHGLILSNLSSVEYFLKNYENCILNIEMCMKTQYAKTSFPKLYIRKIKAFIHLNETMKANSVYTEFLSFLEENFKSDLQRDNLQEEALKALKTKRKNSRTRINCDSLIIPAIEEDRCLTNKAKCGFSENWGTYIEASDVIKKGEVILVETFETFLHINITPTSVLYCITCIKKLDVLIPCQYCGDVMYCSESCKAKHLNEGHRYECQLYSSKLMTDFDPCIILAYRMLLKYITTNEISSKRWLYERKECLVNTNDESCKSLAISCCAMMMYMEENEDFMKEIETFEPYQAASSEDFKFIFAANLFKMAEFISRSRFINDINEKIYGFYPICILFNHSCIPNTTHYTSDCTIVIKAEREIAKGEQIFISYEGLFLTYWNRATDIRKNTIMDVYKFNCTCEACENTIFNKDLSSAFLCKKCNSDNVEIIRKRNLLCLSCRHHDNEVIPKFVQLSKSTATAETELGDSSTIKLFQAINFNTKNIIYFDMCRYVAIISLKAGKLEESLEYIDIIPNMKLFYHFHNTSNEFDELLDYLQICLTGLFSSKENQVFQVNRNLLGKLKKFVDEMQVYVDLFCPTQRRFEKVEAVKKYCKILEDICILEETTKNLKWKSRTINLY